jgi:hypothetical protein
MIYLLTIGLTPGGISTVHIYTQTVHRTTQLTALLGGFLRFEPRVVKINGKSVGFPPSLRLIPWYLPYSWGKSTEKPQSGHGKSSFRAGKTSVMHGKTSVRARKYLSQVLYLSPLFLLFISLSCNFAGFVCLCTLDSSGPPLLSLHVNKWNWLYLYIEEEMIPFNNFCYNSCTVMNAVFRCDFLLYVRFVFHVLFAICLTYLLTYLLHGSESFLRS